MRHDFARVGVESDDVKILAGGSTHVHIAHTREAIEQRSIDGRSRQGVFHRPEQCETPGEISFCKADFLVQDKNSVSQTYTTARASFEFKAACLNVCAKHRLFKKKLRRESLYLLHGDVGVRGDVGCNKKHPEPSNIWGPGLFPAPEGQNLALTALSVPSTFDSGAPLSPFWFISASQLL